MKITKETQELMIIKDSNTIVFVVIAIIMLIGGLTIFKPDVFAEKPPLGVGILWCSLGLFFLFITKTTTITFDKIDRRLTVKLKSLTRERIDECNLDEIKEIELKKIYSGKGYFYRLTIKLDGEKEVVLNPFQSSTVVSVGIFHKSLGNEREIGERISNFLGIPFHEIGPPTLGESLSAITEVVKGEIEKSKEKTR